MSTKRRVGVYAGSFNPFHVGHASIVEQALHLFDKVIVAIGTNPAKANNEKEPFPYNNPILKDVSVQSYTGLLSDFLNEVELIESENAEVFLIRGLRNGDDLQYEQNQLQYIEEMYPSLRTAFLICNRKYEHISSQSLRALKTYSQKEYEKYVYLPIAQPEKVKFGVKVKTAVTTKGFRKQTFGYCGLDD